MRTREFCLLAHHTCALELTKAMYADRFWDTVCQKRPAMGTTPQKDRKLLPCYQTWYCSGCGRATTRRRLFTVRRFQRIKYERRCRKIKHKCSRMKLFSESKQSVPAVASNAFAIFSSIISSSSVLGMSLSILCVTNAIFHRQTRNIRRPEHELWRRHSPYPHREASGGESGDVFRTVTFVFRTVTFVFRTVTFETLFQSSARLQQTVVQLLTR